MELGLTGGVAGRGATGDGTGLGGLGPLLAVRVIRVKTPGGVLTGFVLGSKQ